MTRGFDGTEDRFDDVDSSLTGLSRDVDTGFSNVGTQLTGLGTDIGNQFDQFGNRIDSGFTGLNNNLNTGLGNLSGQVDTRFGELGNNMNTGFATIQTDMGTGFTNLGNAVQQGNQAVLTGQEEGFNAVNQNVSNVGTNIGNQLTETSANVLGGQDQIRSLVEQYGGNQDQYFQSLSQGQQEAAARQGQLQTGLDSFRSDFDSQSTLSNQQRTRIQDAVVGGQSQLREDLAQQAAATQQGLSNVGQDVTRVGQDVSNVDRTTQKNFANVARMISTGFDDGTQETASVRNEFIDRLTTIRSVLTQQGEQIDEGIRNTYSTLVSSFDQQGSLIRNSQNANGETIARAIDGEGNLLLAAFDPAGNRVDQQALNINRLMSQMDELGYRPGTNAMMSQAANMQASVYSGLASPFTSTR
jgi:Flp pilus assembly pilin Flp